MNRAAIVDMETVTAFGDGFDGLWQALLMGRTAVERVERFSVGNYQADNAALIHDLGPAKNRSIIHELVDRLFVNAQNIPPDSCLITATTKSGIDNLEKLRKFDLGDPYDMLLVALTDAVSEKTGLKGEGINISAACASSTVALARAAARIVSGRTDSVLVCCLDVITEFVFSGFSSLQILSKEPSRPFDKNRSGLSLGDGAAYLLLMNAERAKKEGRPVLGSIAGWGVASDAAHITSPARDGRGLIMAVQQAMSVAGVGPDLIAAINAHGTGTVYNDLMELTAFQNIFSGRELPIHSIKGAIGHTLGAAGGIEVCVGIKSLNDQKIPPTPGFISPEQGARGQVSHEEQAMDGEYLLTTNSGFGGINAALVLERGMER